MPHVDPALMAEAAQCLPPWEPAKCNWLFQAFGPAAPWMMRPEAIRAAMDDRCFLEQDRQAAEDFLHAPLLPNQLGAANPVFVVQANGIGVAPDALKKGALREAFFLPLAWEEAEAHAAGLPAGLQTLADQVREDMGMAGTRWHLRRNAAVGFDRVDMSRLPVECGSAWGVLAAALRLANDRVQPRAHVAVSAGWAVGQGVQDVEAVVPKYAAAAEFGCKVFFTTPAQVERLRTDGKAVPGVEARAIPIAEPKPGKALGELLHEMQAAPLKSDGAPFGLRKQYANGWWRNRVSREDYMFENVTAELAEEIRSKDPTKSSLAALGETDREAVVVSSPSAPLLSVLLLRPKHVLFVYTSQFTADYGVSPSKKIQPFSNGAECKDALVEPDDYGAILRAIEGFFSTNSPGGRVVDCTGGKKTMSAAACLAASFADASVVCIDQENPGGGFHGVGSEKLRCVWPGAAAPAAGSGGRAFFVTRHAGAKEWAARKGLAVDFVVGHLEVSQVAPGDTVVGTLPVNLAAEVCRRGGRYLHLALPLPPDFRGRELTADDMDRFGAYLREFRIKASGGDAPCADPGGAL